MHTNEDFVLTVPKDAIERQIERESRFNLWQAVNVPDVTLDRVSSYRQALRMNDQALANQEAENIRRDLNKARAARQALIERRVIEGMLWLLVVAGAIAAWVAR